MSTAARLAVAALLAVVAAPAAAHSPIEGIGIFYSGALHPLVTPPHLIALLALGLLLGQAGQRATGDDDAPLAALAAPLAALGVALVAGVLRAGLHPAEEPDTDRVLLALAAATGLAVAAAWRAPQGVRLVVALAVGLATGLASAPTGVSDAERWTSLAGTAAASLMLAAYVAVMVAMARRPPWLAIAARVLGSWMAAAALLVLALSFAPVRGG
jgi:hydrogenase/urease accessory protein HupE